MSSKFQDLLTSNTSWYRGAVMKRQDSQPATAGNASRRDSTVGASIQHGHSRTDPEKSYTNSTYDTGNALPSGVGSPRLLLDQAGGHYQLDHKELANALRRDDDETDEHFPDPVLELVASNLHRKSSVLPPEFLEEARGGTGAAGAAAPNIPQGVPKELKSLWAEIIFVLVCTAGQVLFALTQGNVLVTQLMLRDALGILPSQTPWLVGSSFLASGLSVIIAGSFADLAPPKPLMVGAFVWEAAWNGIAAGSVSPKLKVMFFVARAMQGLAVGVLVSASMSILGRVYKPGIRKTRVFCLMAAGAPLGFWIGCVQGGALADHLPWVFGSTSMLLGLCAVAAYFTIPSLRPAKDSEDADAPSLRQFDWLGALCASAGCGLVLFGLTQGPSAHWHPYTYATIIAGFLLFLAFYFVERRVERPLIPNGLWKTPGFAALLISYFLGYGSFSGSWQFYAIQFWQRYQGVTPLTIALYILPNAIVGVLAAWLVSKTLHVMPGHWIFLASMICFGMGSVFFLPQTYYPNITYWALSMPGVALATFGPDLSFAAAAIFITSSVPRSYQGSAGSLLVTVQNLCSAIMTSISDSVGVSVDELPTGEIGLVGIRAIWWFGLACAVLGALITGFCVRIPKAEEEDHVVH